MHQASDMTRTLDTPSPEKNKALQLCQETIVFLFVVRGFAVKQQKKSKGRNMVGDPNSQRFIKTSWTGRFGHFFSS